ncbi:MAG TPA: MarR family transcriptional regulator [Moraxellaceae bacterium]|nr:MarR family transcriptional regulator [Moraxellaceae bacterium]
MTLTLSEQQTEALRAFRMIFRAVRRHYQLIEKHAGISGAQAWALSLLADQPGVTVSALASAMSIHQSTASNLVDKLVQLGLAERHKRGTDLRVTQLEATDRGRQLLQNVAGPVTGLLPDAISRMPADKLGQLNASLTDLISTLSEVEAEAAGIPLSEILRD